MAVEVNSGMRYFLPFRPNVQIAYYNAEKFAQYHNEVLYRLGLLTLPIDWTGSRWLAVVTVAMADAWKVTPLVMLILLAGLQAIPRELYEAARTDGAGPWQQFWRITLPLLRPALTMAFIIRGVDAFRIFALPLALVGRYLPVLSTFAYVEYLEYGTTRILQRLAVRFCW